MTKIEDEEHLTREQIEEIVREQLAKAIRVMIWSSLIVVVAIVSNLVYFSYQHGKLEQKESDDRATIEQLQSEGTLLQRQHAELMVQVAKLQATLEKVDSTLERHMDAKR